MPGRVPIFEKRDQKAGLGLALRRWNRAQLFLDIHDPFPITIAPDVCDTCIPAWIGLQGLSLWNLPAYPALPDCYLPSLGRSLGGLVPIGAGQAVSGFLLMPATPLTLETECFPFIYSSSLLLLLSSPGEGALPARGLLCKSRGLD